jgi:hypothetical protein
MPPGGVTRQAGEVVIGNWPDRRAIDGGATSPAARLLPAATPRAYLRSCPGQGGASDQASPVDGAGGTSNRSFGIRSST